MGRKLKLSVNSIYINSYIHKDEQVISFLRVTRFLTPILALILFQLLAALATPGATHVQQASNSNVGGAAMTSFSATFASPTAAGNAIILGITFGNVSPTITATDSQGNTYVQAVQTYDSGHRQGSAILYASNIKGGSSTTVTVKFSSSVAYLALGIHEYNGVATSAALDATTGAIGKASAL